MHQKVDVTDFDKLQQVYTALDEFAWDCYHLLCKTEEDMSGFHDGMRYLAERFIDIVEPILEEHRRIRH